MWLIWLLVALMGLVMGRSFALLELHRRSDARVISGQILRPVGAQLPAMSRMRPAVGSPPTGAKSWAMVPVIAGAFVAAVIIIGAPLGELSVPSTVAIVATYVYLACISVALTVIDISTHRLPNVIVLPSYGVFFAAFLVACAAGEPWQSILRATAGGVLYFGFLFALRAPSRQGMGGGDVKLAGVLGMATGWMGWGSFVVGVASAFVLGGIVATVLLALGRGSGHTRIPFGPYLLAGAWVGICLPLD